MMMTHSDQTAASEQYSVAFGNIVVSDEASAAGVASVPTPDAQSASDWFVYERLGDHFIVTTDIGRLLNGIRKEIDSRAMRKVDIGEDLLDIAEASALSSGAVVVTFTRTLIKLH